VDKSAPECLVGERGIIVYEPLQILLQLASVDKYLVGLQEKRNDLGVEVIFRRKHRTEGQVVKVREIDAVALFDLTLELCGKDQAKRC
jgi:hypothetical protein